VSESLDFRNSELHAVVYLFIVSFYRAIITSQGCVGDLLGFIGILDLLVLFKLDLLFRSKIGLNDYSCLGFSFADLLGFLN
jgi:hypothetical protein